MCSVWTFTLPSDGVIASTEEGEAWGAAAAFMEPGSELSTLHLWFYVSLLTAARGDELCRWRPGGPAKRLSWSIGSRGQDVQVEPASRACAVEH